MPLPMDDLAAATPQSFSPEHDAPVSAVRHPLFFLILAAAALHGLLSVFAVPPWQHYDEPTHFEYSWLLANRLKLPRVGDTDPAMRREVVASMVEHGFFHASLELRRDLLRQDEPVWIGISELQHPPLYYILAALPLRLFRHHDVVVQLYAARLVSWGFYLGTLWMAYRIMGELIGFGHAVSYAVPGLMALVPGYVNLMTAVNNDVGAVATFSLFLWLSMRAIARGPTVLRLLGIGVAAASCIWTKSTGSVALLLIPIALVLSCRFQFRWWFAAVPAGVALALIVALFGWGDAAFWYRDTEQRAPTSQKAVQTPLGERAIVIELSSTVPQRQVTQFLPQSAIESLQGMTVTLGAWIWASEPISICMPTLHDETLQECAMVRADRTPAFYAITKTVPLEVTALGVALWPLGSGAAESETAWVCYDGVVLEAGVRHGIPEFESDLAERGSWGGLPLTNRVRNGSAESTWPRVRPWIDQFLRRYARRSPSWMLTSLLDWQRTGQMYPDVLRRQFETFWAGVGWGEILPRPVEYWGLALATLSGALGAAIGFVRVKGFRGRAVSLFAVAGLLVWGNSFLRFQPVMAKVFIPVARYAYPVIIPTLLAFVAGWWTLVPRACRRWFLPVLFLAFGGFAVSSWIALVSTYRWR